MSMRRPTTHLSAAGAEGKEVPEWRKLPVKPDYSRWKVSRDNAAKRGKEVRSSLVYFGLL